jgi:hypothetical protein
MTIKTVLDVENESYGFEIKPETNTEAALFLSMFKAKKCERSIGDDGSIEFTFST